MAVCTGTATAGRSNGGWKSAALRQRAKLCPSPRGTGVARRMEQQFEIRGSRLRRS